MAGLQKRRKLKHMHKAKPVHTRSTQKQEQGDTRISAFLKRLLFLCCHLSKAKVRTNAKHAPTILQRCLLRLNLL